MPSMDFTATLAPRAINVSLSLSLHVRYQCQNVSGLATLFFREATATPPATDRAFRIEPGGYFVLAPEGDPLWFWTDDPAGCPVVVTEAA